MSLVSSISGLFKWRQFEPEVILLAVGWYLRFSLSYRDVEELLQERGICVDHVTLWRWVQRYAPELEKRLRKRLRGCHELTAMELEGNTGQHQAGEGNKVQAGQGGGQPLVIARQPPKPSRPGKGAFHYPAAWQEHKTPLGFRQFDHLQLHAVGGGGRCGRFAPIPLVDVGQFDGVASNFLTAL